MAIIEVPDVLEYLGIASVPDVQEKALNAIIEGLEADLEAFLGERPLVPTTYTDELVRIDRLGRIKLRKTPVRTIAAFKIEGVVQSTIDYLVRPWGITDLYSVFWGPSLLHPEPLLTVDYTAGLDGHIPTSPFARAARSGLLRAAARDFNQVIRLDSAGVATIAVEGTTYVFAGDRPNAGRDRGGQGGWLPEELKALIRWKHRNGT